MYVVMLIETAGVEKSVAYVFCCKADSQSFLPPQVIYGTRSISWPFTGESGSLSLWLLTAGPESLSILAAPESLSILPVAERLSILAAPGRLSILAVAERLLILAVAERLSILAAPESLDLNTV